MCMYTGVPGSHTMGLFYHSPSINLTIVQWLAGHTEIRLHSSNSPITGSTWILCLCHARQVLHRVDACHGAARAMMGTCRCGSEDGWGRGAGMTQL